MLFTGKVILEWGEEVPDDRDTPRAPQQLLASPAADVGDIRVGQGEAKDPAERGQVRQSRNPLPWAALIPGHPNTVSIRSLLWRGDSPLQPHTT